MGCSNTSLGYLNYPTQVIFKCCKLIPVMIGGIFIQNKRYGLIDFFAVLLMSIGLIFFTIADQSVSPKFDMTGVSQDISLYLITKKTSMSTTQTLRRSISKFLANYEKSVLKQPLSNFLFENFAWDIQIVDPIRTPFRRYWSHRESSVIENCHKISFVRVRDSRLLKKNTK